MKKVLFMLFVTSIAISNIGATGFRKCASADILQRQILENPFMSINREKIEAFTNSYVRDWNRNGNSQGRQSSTIVTIPVVFHVIYNTAAQNVSDSMILAQIDRLNKDYSGTNSDISSLPSVFNGIKAGNTGIQFCLAQRDPSGNSSTGIIRKHTTVTSWSDDDAVKYTAQGGDDAWDRSRYLNVWLCNLGGGLLGYAQFPGGPASTDGVVILYSSLPGGQAPYNMGRTMTHEIGHWLNLYHTWGDDNGGCSGSDQVDDTPNSADANYGCPTFPSVTCSNGPNGDLFQDYMDYTDDACMFMFTAGQSARMNALFVPGGARVSLLTSNGCTPRYRLNQLRTSPHRRPVFVLVKL